MPRERFSDLLEARLRGRVSEAALPYAVHVGGVILGYFNEGSIPSKAREAVKAHERPWVKDLVYAELKRDGWPGPVQEKVDRLA